MQYNQYIQELKAQLDQKTNENHRLQKQINDSLKQKIKEQIRESMQTIQNQASVYGSPKNEGTVFRRSSNELTFREPSFHGRRIQSNRHADLNGKQFVFNELEPLENDKILLRVADAESKMLPQDFYSAISKSNWNDEVAGEVNEGDLRKKSGSPRESTSNMVEMQQLKKPVVPPLPLERLSSFNKMQYAEV